MEAKRPAGPTDKETQPQSRQLQHLTAVRSFGSISLQESCKQSLSQELPLHAPGQGVTGAAVSGLSSPDSALGGRFECTATGICVFPLPSFTVFVSVQNRVRRHRWREHRMASWDACPQAPAGAPAQEPPRTEPCSESRALLPEGRALPQPCRSLGGSITCLTLHTPPAAPTTAPVWDHQVTHLKSSHESLTQQFLQQNREKDQNLQPKTAWSEIQS